MSTENIETTPRQQVAALILKYVNDNDWVSFAELERHLTNNGLEPCGDLSMVVNSPNSNVYVWVAMSQAFAEAVQDLLRAGKVYLWHSQPLVYMIDGKLPRLPLAKRMPRGGYKAPRWLPVCLRNRPGKGSGVEARVNEKFAEAAAEDQAERDPAE